MKERMEGGREGKKEGEREGKKEIGMSADGLDFVETQY